MLLQLLLLYNFSFFSKILSVKGARILGILAPFLIRFNKKKKNFFFLQLYGYDLMLNPLNIFSLHCQSYFILKVFNPKSMGQD